MAEQATLDTWRQLGKSRGFESRFVTLLTEKKIYVRDEKITLNTAGSEKKISGKRITSVYEQVGPDHLPSKGQCRESVEMCRIQSGKWSLRASCVRCGNSEVTLMAERATP